jgi:hypothetical protein
VSPGEDARGWWRYVLGIVVAELRERKNRRSPGYLTQRRKARLRYTALYVQQRAASLSKRDLAEMMRMEDAFEVHDLIFFRCTALKRLRAEKKKIQRTKTSWYGRLVGSMTRGGTAPGESHVDDADDDAPPLMSLSLEEREALLAAMDVDPGAYGDAHTHLFRSQAAEQRMYAVALECDEVAVRIIDTVCVLDVSATLSSAALHIEGKAHRVSLRTRMDTLEVVNVLTGSTLSRQTGRAAVADPAGEGADAPSSRQEEGVPLLTVAVERNHGCLPKQTSVSVRLAELDFLLDPGTLQRLVTFWQIPDPAVDLQVRNTVKISMKIQENVY